MTSKSEVASGEAVKSRKNLAPDSKLKARASVRSSSLMDSSLMENEVPLKVATKSAGANTSSSAAVSTNSRRRNNLASPGVKNHGGKKAPVRKSAQEASVRNLRAPLLGDLGAADKESLETSKKKTQAQMARERLATAAAKKLHTHSQANAKAQEAKRQSQSSIGRSKVNKQERPDAPVKPGNQLIQ